MPDKIPVEKFLGFTDLPVFSKPPGWLTQLQNMRVMPGGYLEARGGNDQLKISGGTAAAISSAGYVSGFHEHTLPNTATITVATSGGTSFGANQALKAWFALFPLAVAQNDAIYFTSDSKFSRVVMYISQAAVNGATAPTYVYEYPKSANWATTGTLTTSATPTFTATGEQTLEFAVPSDWAQSTLPSTTSPYQYGVRIRVSNAPSNYATAPLHGNQRVYGDWLGDRQLWGMTVDPSAGTANGILKQYLISGTTTVWNTNTSSLFSGQNSRTRFASYRGVLYFVNGKEQKRWEQTTTADMGFSKPTSSGMTVNYAGGAGNLTGTFLYAITYGYGPNGEWGESNELLQTTVAAGAAAQQIILTYNLTSIPSSGIADVIYVYRTPDLASAPAAAYASFPYYRIATVTRGAAGTFPATYTDNTVAFPFPPVALDITTNTPPSRCRFIAVHKNRMFLGSNNQYPGRVWWSDPFEAEAFNQDENFADFTRSTGGILSGMAEFNDQMVVFTEDQMFGIANVDTDLPDVYVIHPGVGCVAPDSIAVGNGVICWLARGGVYLWTGDNLPVRITDEFKLSTFGRMSAEGHGGSRGAIHNRLYELTLIDSQGTVGATWEYNLVTQSWCNITQAAGAAAPFLAVTAPVGHADAGVRHILRTTAGTGGSSWKVYLGEYTTADDGTGYNLSVRVHFGPPGYRAFSPNRLASYYDANSGLAADPALSLVNAAYQWATPGLATAYTDPGTQYQLVVANASQKNFGSGGIVGQWLATTTSGGSLNGQRLHSMYLEGEFSIPRRQS